MSSNDGLANLHQSVIEHLLVNSAEAIDFLLASLASLYRLLRDLDRLLVALGRLIVACGELLKLVADSFKVSRRHVFLGLGSLLEFWDSIGGGGLT